MPVYLRWEIYQTCIESLHFNPELTDLGDVPFDLRRQLLGFFLETLRFLIRLANPSRRRHFLVAPHLFLPAPVIAYRIADDLPDERQSFVGGFYCIGRAHFGTLSRIRVPRQELASAFSDVRSSSLRCRRAFAASFRRSSSSVSGTRRGTSTGFPLRSIATKVR